jgi:DNA-3-methyladenine glycosylase II
MINNKEITKGIQYLSENDKTLGKLIAKAPAYKLKPHKRYYESLLDAIIGQQLSTTAADSISRKFFDYFENDPTPEKILSADDAELRKLGLSAAKVKYVKDLSDKVLRKIVNFKNFLKKTDEDIINEFTQVKGIGEWTAHMFLIFTLGRLNVLPVSDLGIRKAIMNNYRLKELPDAEAIRKIASKRKWAPYCSIASWYLWKSLEFKD